ncbi:MAG: hypothetical protein ACI30J_03315, partial [Paludibacteraceae bacterium]
MLNFPFCSKTPFPTSRGVLGGDTSEDLLDDLPPILSIYTELLARCVLLYLVYQVVHLADEAFVHT